MYAQKYILHVFEDLIFMSIAGNVVPLCFLTLLDYFFSIPNYSWGSHTCISLPVTM